MFKEISLAEFNSSLRERRSRFLASASPDPPVKTYFWCHVPLSISVEIFFVDCKREERCLQGTIFPQLQLPLHASGGCPSILDSYMSDYFFLIVGWLHAMAAVAWLGGSIFYWLVLRPAIRSRLIPEPVTRFAGSEFNQLVTLSMWILVITGGVLMFNRLSGPSASLPYGATLGLKILLSAWMFFLVAGRRSKRRTQFPQGPFRRAVNALGHINMTIVLGAIVFLLSDTLRMLVERQLGNN